MEIEVSLPRRVGDDESPLTHLLSLLPWNMGVFGLIGAAVLLGDHMFHMIDRERKLKLLQTAVLAASIGSLANLPAKSGTDCHQG